MLRCYVVVGVRGVVGGVGVAVVDVVGVDMDESDDGMVIDVVDGVGVYVSG